MLVSQTQFGLKNETGEGLGGIMGTGDVGRALAWRVRDVILEFGLGFRKINHDFTVVVPAACIYGVRFGIMRLKRNSLYREILECWFGFA